MPNFCKCRRVCLAGFSLSLLPCRRPYLHAAGHLKRMLSFILQLHSTLFAVLVLGGGMCGGVGGAAGVRAMRASTFFYLSFPNQALQCLFLNIFPSCVAVNLLARLQARLIVRSRWSGRQSVMELGRQNHRTDWEVWKNLSGAPWLGKSVMKWGDGDYISIYCFITGVEKGKRIFLFFLEKRVKPRGYTGSFLKTVMVLLHPQLISYIFSTCLPVYLNLSGLLAVVQCLVLHPKCDAVCLAESTGLTRCLCGLSQGHL